MATFYVAAGVNHFIHPGPYEKIIPRQLPYPTTLVYVSGVFEILFGVMLIFQQTRRFAAFGIILLLIAIFPANIQMMINYYNQGNPGLWLMIVRLPLQLLLVYWAYLYTGKRFTT